MWQVCITRHQQPYLRELGSWRFQLPVRVGEVLQHTLEWVDGHVSAIAQPQAVNVRLQRVCCLPSSGRSLSTTHHNDGHIGRFISFNLVLLGDAIIKKGPLQLGKRSGLHRDVYLLT